MNKLYIIHDLVLGVGSFGKVVLAESAFNSSLKFAIKIVSKKLLDQTVDGFREVFHCLKMIDHPTLLKYYDLYENDLNFYLVMEYFEGQQLLDVIISLSNITDGKVLEHKARGILK
mmetsp:Transcript_43148/g.50595  ORF Transcript_43148/g.50595 Transcript_43148/m.50595 type:complete len:116 (-) Transcript_43148:153-500(-)